MSAALSNWYAAHSPVRRLRAIDDPAALIVYIWLEPTSDGDDALPVWLANSRRWANDLMLLADREVQLNLLVSGTAAESHVDVDADAAATVVAELSWRDSWDLS